MIVQPFTTILIQRTALTPYKINLYSEFGSSVSSSVKRKLYEKLFQNIVCIHFYIDYIILFIILVSCHCLILEQDMRFSLLFFKNYLSFFFYFKDMSNIKLDFCRGHIIFKSKEKTLILSQCISTL